MNGTVPVAETILAASAAESECSAASYRRASLSGDLHRAVTADRSGKLGDRLKGVDLRALVRRRLANLQARRVVRRDRRARLHVMRAVVAEIDPRDRGPRPVQQRVDRDDG